MKNENLKYLLQFFYSCYKVDSPLSVTYNIDQLQAINSTYCGELILYVLHILSSQFGKSLNSNLLQKLFRNSHLSPGNRDNINGVIARNYIKSVAPDLQSTEKNRIELLARVNNNKS